MTPSNVHNSNNHPIVVALWPHDEKDVSKGLEGIKTVGVIFTLIWLLVAFLAAGISIPGSGSNFYVIKGIFVGLFALYITTRGLTHLVIDDNGLQLQRNIGGLGTGDKQEIPWPKIKRIYVEPTANPSRLTWNLCIEETKGRKHRIKLSKIRTAQKYSDFRKALQAFATASQLDLDPDLISEAVNKSDPTYTALWLDALTSAPRIDRLQPLAQGATLEGGRYVLERKLGAGGQGTAYLATVSDGTAAVLKEYVLPVFVDIKAKRQALQRFENECKMLSGLKHQSIVAMHDCFVEDQRAFLVLEYIDGKTLKQQVEDHGPLDSKEAIRLGISMCEILEFLHGQEHPVLHRDFTPDNLMLKCDGSLKLIDFMVAETENRSTSTSATVVGKHKYLPPEQFRGKATTQSDIYALGAMLFFLITGAEPEPLSCSSPRQLRKDVSTRLDSIIQCCTALDCEERYKSAAEVKADLMKLSCSIYLVAEERITLKDYDKGQSLVVGSNE